MSTLFTSGVIGSLELSNRLVRSATAECMADEEGYPKCQLQTLYRNLARGGIGLIITGHMYVHPSGKAHAEMTGVYSDKLIPALAELADAVHDEGGRIIVQINHGGIQCSLDDVPEIINPSAIDETMVLELVDAYAQAARRVKSAGFDGVQIHSAHGYLISQFLSPSVNDRSDRWGGDIGGRMSFLREVSRAIRDQVGPDYPVLIKLGMKDGIEDGLTLEEGVQIVRALSGMGINGVEMSGGIGGKRFSNTRKGIRSEEKEAYFLRFAQVARPVTELPLILVGGFRSRTVMEKVLNHEGVDFISMCRPLINDPDFPNKLRLGVLERSECLSSNNCWPTEDGVGIACKCPVEKVTDTGE
jgi:2,4-dienoyl-CoA reductase-like NADH-dependent reductase (Old Yellow Enzyme family)